MGQKDTAELNAYTQTSARLGVKQYSLEYKNADFGNALPHFNINCGQTQVGQISLNTNGNTCEIGCYIEPKYRNQGIATQAIRTVLPLIFDSCDTVVMYITKSNAAIRAVAQKLGFEQSDRITWQLGKQSTIEHADN